MAVPQDVVQEMVPNGVADTSVDRTPYTSKASTSENRRVYFYVYADASGAQSSVPTLQNDVRLGVRDGQFVPSLQGNALAADSKQKPPRHNTQLLKAILYPQGVCCADHLVDQGGSE